jgi:uncharacterized membrane protein
MTHPPAPAARAEDHHAPLPVRVVPPAAVGRWLRLGLRDLARVPGPSLLHGVLVALGGWVVAGLSVHLPWVAPGAFSGFVIVGPVLCTGLYELSRLLARGGQPGFADVANAWRRDSRPLVRLGFVLLGAGSLWVLASALLFRLFVPEPPATAPEFLRYVLVGQGDLLFSLWLLLGGLGVAVVYAVAAVSPPLLLGRRVGLRRALLTSARAVGDNPVTLGLWGAVILAGVALSLATGMLGFVVVVPWIGHATWHAYRDLVVTDAVPLRYE